MVSTLLNNQNSNISHVIDAADHHALPADIKRAVAFILDNLSETITLADIAKATRLNARPLQKGFKRSFGKSPMQVLRDVRLDTARYFLSVKRSPPSVTDAAYQAGFSHLGRFSQAYKMRFGRFPSEDVLN